MKIKNKIFAGVLSFTGLVGCVSRAPTECELDKRSGLYPSSDCGSAVLSVSLDSQPKTQSAPALQAGQIPVRSQPVVKKIWVSPQIIEGGHWMDGTWLYLETEPSQWLGSVPRSEMAKAQKGEPSVAQKATNNEANKVEKAQPAPVRQQKIARAGGRK